MGFRPLTVAVAVVVVVAVAAAAYLAYTSIQRPAVRLVVASRLSAEEADAVRAAFLASDMARRYNIVDVEIKKLDYSLWKDLSVRGEVDLLLVGEPSIFNSLCEVGALRYVDSGELVELARRLPREFVGYSKGGSICWLGIGLGVYGFIVNRDFLNRYNLPEPASWADLANPVYARPLDEGRYVVSFPLPSKSGTARTTVMGVLQRYGWSRGWQLLTAIGAVSSFVTSSERARDDATAGVVAVAPAYIGYGLQAERASSGRAVFVTPSGETS